MENKRKIEIVEKIIEYIENNNYYPIGICLILEEHNLDMLSNFQVSNYEYYYMMYEFFKFSTGYYDCNGNRTEKCDGAFRFKNNEKRLKYLHKKLKELKNER